MDAVSSSNRSVLLIVIFSVVFATLGFFVGQKFTSQNKTVKEVSSPSNTPLAFSNPIFKRQTAIFEGKVTKIEGNNLTVEDSQNHSVTFPLSPDFFIIDRSSNKSEATPSTDQKLIQKDNLALFVLELINGQYQAVSMTYLAPTPPPQIKK